MPVLLRGCLAVLLLVGGLALWATRGKSGIVPPVKTGKKPGLGDIMAMGAGILAIECAFLWLLSAAPQPLENAAIALEQKLMPEAAAVREESESATTVSGNWLWDQAHERALPRRTKLKPGAKPEVFIRLPDERDAERLLKNQVYVRAFALDEYLNGTWSIRESKELDLEANDEGWIQLNGSEKGGILHEVFHGRSAAGRNVLTALQGVQAVRLPNLRMVGDGIGYLPEVSGISGFEYLASSSPVVLDDLETAETVALVDASGTAGRFQRLALRAAGEGPLLERLKNIQQFLRDGYGYSLVTKNTKNLDPLENFLFEEKRGHCEFFATAGALMARELGVESRVAYGWAGGQYFSESSMFVFRAREAHAWVELNLKGHGWVVMEPTPPVVLGNGVGAPRIAAEGESISQITEEFGEQFAGNGLNGSRGIERLALGLMCAFGTLAVAVLFLRREKSRESGSSGIPFIGKARGGYHRAWSEAFRKKTGGTMPGLTLAKQVGVLEQKPDFGHDLVSYHYGVRYEQKQPDAESEGLLLKKIESWRESSE